MNSRDRVMSILNLEEPDVVAVWDLIWSETLNRWRKEGFPDNVEVRDHFSFDIHMIDCRTNPGYDSIVYEENERSRITTDEWGSMNKSLKGRVESYALVRPAIRNLEDFKERIEPFLNIDDQRRIYSPNYLFRKELERGIKNLQEKYFVIASIRESFTIVRGMIGLESLLVSFIKNQSFVS